MTNPDITNNGDICNTKKRKRITDDNEDKCNIKFKKIIDEDILKNQNKLLTIEIDELKNNLDSNIVKVH